MKPRLSTIHAKIIIAMIGVSLIVGLTIFISSLILVYKSSQTSLNEELKSIANILAQSSRAAMASNDKKTAKLNLQSLDHIPHITHAELKHFDGSLLATYRHQTTKTSYLGNILFDPVTVQKAITVDDKYLGAVFITSNSESLVSPITTLLTLFIGLLVLSVIIAYSVSYILQRNISDPIRKLSSAMENVAESTDNDFILDVEKDDEIGQLFIGFNAMLKELADRDAKLKDEAKKLGETLDVRNQQITEEERKRIIWLQNLARFLQHELKNTMLGIRSSLDMIERKAANPNIHQYIDRARNSIIFMGRLLHNVGETSGLEAALLEEDFEVFDLSEASKTWLDTYIHATGNTNFELTTNPDCYIMGNNVRMAQLMEKLAANAVSHSSENTMVKINISATEEEVILSVANQGSPLPLERGHIFDLFVSMRENAQKGSENIGVGLYVVRLISQAHNGYVEAHDLIEEQGAIFSVHLPRCKNPILANE